ncbi:MAG: TolC family protein [Dokdonella sp.]
MLHKPLRWSAATVAALIGAGCATYSPLRLGEGRGVASVAQLNVPTANLSLSTLPPHRFDPSDGLDVTELAMLAIANNPELKIKRDELGVAQAQAFAAGLLPDPQLSAGVDFPHPSAAGLTTAYTLGLSEDIGAWLMRSSRTAVTRAQASQINLDLTWAEWQTIAQARLQFDQTVSLRATEQRLQTEQAALTPVARYVEMALRAGNLTYDAASAGLNALSDVQRRLADNAIALDQAQTDMHVLLGLAPSAALDLVGEPFQVFPTSAQVDRALADLPRRRPDLLALQAGYAAQDEKFRGAILAQFPALTLGFTRARDTSNVNTRGFTVAFSLPLFDRNRGNIAIETATRQRLKDDYELRLLKTRSDMQRLLADLAILDRQQTASMAHAAQLDSALHSAEHAWQAGLIDWPTYLGIRGTALAADFDLINAREERSKQAIALQTLLGSADFSESVQAPIP